jgi:uncharacterized protein YqgC (DUF456 family)
MLGGVLLVAWAGHFTAVGWGTVAGAVVLTGMMIAVDWAAGALGARAFGASRWAMLGAAAGAVVGLFFGLPGILLGPVVGGIVFQYWKDPDFERALHAGAGVFVGFVVGSALKVALGFALVGLVLLALVV